MYQSNEKNIRQAGGAGSTPKDSYLIIGDVSSGPDEGRIRSRGFFFSAFPSLSKELRRFFNSQAADIPSQKSTNPL